MKTRISKNVLLLFITLGMLSCKKENKNSNNNDSPVRQQISLEVDGVAHTYTATGSSETDPFAIIKSVAAGLTFDLDAEDDNSSFHIAKSVIDGVDSYSLNGSTTNVAANFAGWETEDEAYSTLYNPLVITPKSRLQFTITERQYSSTTNKTYTSGNFSGVLYNVSQTDSVIITNGRFDILD